MDQEEWMKLVEAEINRLHLERMHVLAHETRCAVQQLAAGKKENAMKMEMMFKVTKVVSAEDNNEQLVELVQAEESWVNPMYRSSVLSFFVVSDDELKRWGPGLQVKVTVEA